jgi:hypothetical protein
MVDLWVTPSQAAGSNPRHNKTRFADCLYRNLNQNWSQINIDTKQNGKRKQNKTKKSLYLPFTSLSKRCTTFYELSRHPRASIFGRSSVFSSKNPLPTPVPAYLAARPTLAN